MRETRHSAVILLIVLSALAMLLDIFPDIQKSSLFVAVGIVSGSIEIIGFLRDRNSGGREKLPVPRPPSPPQDFTGRGKEIEGLLKSFDRGATITGLRGTGGIGKTALALVMADRLKSRFPDGQIFLKLEGTRLNPLEPAEAMAQVIRAFRGSEERLPEYQNELQGLYNSVLEGKRILLLLDNAADDKQVIPLLPPKGCAALVTSRQNFTLPGMPQPFSLDTMKPEEARDLLLKICPRIGDRAGELARLCGHLPLALRAAASFLAVKIDLEPSAYLEELRSERTRLEKIGREGVDLDVEACFDLSYSRLPAVTARAFRTLSVFPSDFDAAAEEVICKDEGHQHLSELLRWSLVEYQHRDEEGEGRYHLHDLVRIFAASRLHAKDRAQAEQRHAEHYRNVLSASDYQYMQGGENVSTGLALFDKEWSNIQAGWAWAIGNQQASDAAVSLCNSYPDAGSYVLDLRLHPQEKIRWAEAGLAAARQMKDRIFYGMRLGDLGNACSDLGEPRKAIKFYEQALAIAREIGDRRGERIHLGNLGSAYSYLGEPRKAIEFLEQALAIAKEIGDQQSERFHLMNLGSAYSYLGEPRKAIEFHEQALAIAKEIGDRRVEGNILSNLGNAHSYLGEARKATKFYEQALAIAREIGDRCGEGNRLGNLGFAYFNLGEPRKAIKFYEQALAIAREVGNLRGEGTALGNLGNAYANLGETRKGIEHYEQALAIAREIGDKRNEGIWLGNLGNAYADLGEPCQAIEFFKQHLVVTLEVGDRRDEGIACWNLGLHYEKAGDLQRAAEMMQICVDFEREIGHPDAEKDADYLKGIQAKMK